MSKQHTTKGTVTIPLSEYLELTSTERRITEDDLFECLEQYAEGHHISRFLQNQTEKVKQYLIDNYGTLYSYYSDWYHAYMTKPLSISQADDFAIHVVYEGELMRLRRNAITNHRRELEERANEVKRMLREVHDTITELHKAPFYKKHTYRRRLRKCIQGLDQSKLDFNRAAISLDMDGLEKEASKKTREIIEAYKKGKITT